MPGAPRPVTPRETAMPRTTSTRHAAMLLLAGCLLGGGAMAQTSGPGGAGPNMAPHPTAPTARALAGPRAPISSAAPTLKKAELPSLNSIVAVVDGSVISREDVQNRVRLFTLSTGLRLSPEMADRLSPQITKSLIDEKLQLQELQRRKIVIGDADIANAIKDIERRNNMAPGALRNSLTGQGVAMRTLVDQLRVQLGWVRVIREELGQAADVSDRDINDRIARLKAEVGQPQYRVSEIFIPVDQPTQDADAQRFAEAVITQLRSGAPFPIVAAQFSSGQTALQGGDLGWVRPDQLDASVAALVAQMPAGAISNAQKVAGGYAVVTVRGKRELGRETATVLHVRQAYFAFASTLVPSAPTPQQQDMLAKAQALSKNAKSCDEVEAANAAMGNQRPSDPGEVQLEALNPPQLRAILGELPAGKATGPLVAPDGIAVIMVCSREVSNDAAPPKAELANQIINERAELASRQLLDDLRRRAVIQRRDS